MTDWKTMQYDAEIEAGLRWPDGRPIDYERDQYFIDRPLALTLPPSMRGTGPTEGTHPCSAKP